MEEIESLIREAIAENMKGMEARFAEGEAALNARERQLAERELRGEAKTLLQQRGLPEVFAAHIDVTSREQMTAGVEAVEQAFRGAVEERVALQLRGQAPKAAAPVPEPVSEESLTDAEYYRRRLGR